MTDPAKLLRKRLPVILLLAAVALLRAERGTAELQGRAGAPSRLFHLAPEAGGWKISLLGYDSRVPEHFTARPRAVVAAWRERARDTFEQMEKALP